MTDQERQKAEELERKLRHAIEPRVTRKQTYQRIDIAERVKLNQAEHAMGEAHQKCRDAQVPPVVEQRQETPIQTA